MGYGCTLEEAQWDIERNGSNWLGKALVELRNTLEAERIATEYSGNLFKEQKPLAAPTNTDLCASALSAVGDVTQLQDVDLRVAAQVFVGESHVQQAALFGMDQSGAIVQPE